MSTYTDFLAAKVDFDRRFGFDIDPARINPILLPHQRAIVRRILARLAYSRPPAVPGRTKRPSRRRPHRRRP